MKLKDINEIKEDGLVVFMPSGIQATLFNEGENILVKYYNLTEDKYTHEDFYKLINEGIFIFNDRPTTQVMESEDIDDIEQFPYCVEITDEVGELTYQADYDNEKAARADFNDNKYELLPNHKIELLHLVDSEGFEVLDSFEQGIDDEDEEDDMDESIIDKDGDWNLIQTSSTPVQLALELNLGDSKLQIFLKDNKFVVSLNDAIEASFTLDNIDGLLDFIKNNYPVILEKDTLEELIDSQELEDELKDEEEFEESILTKLSKKGFIRESLSKQYENKMHEAFENVKNPQGNVYKAMQGREKHYLTPEFKLEMLQNLDKIQKQFPDMHIRQQAQTFMNELTMQEYYDIKVIQKFIDNYVDIMNPKNESLEDYNDPQGQITLKDAKKQFEKLVEEAHDIYFQGYKFIDITLLEVHCPAFSNINWEDIPELIRSWGYVVLEEPNMDQPAIALGKEFTEDDVRQMIKDFNEENGFDESLKEDKEEDLNKLQRLQDKEAENVPNGSKEMYKLNKKYGKLRKKVHKHYAKNENVTTMAEDIRNGNKSGEDPEFGAWLLETSIDEKWEQLTKAMQMYLLDGIADYVQQGSLKEEDLILEIDPEAGLTKEDVLSLDMFSDEEIDTTYKYHDLQLHAFISYEIKSDKQAGNDKQESFKLKKKKNKKQKIEDSMDEAIYLKNKDGNEIGPFKDQDAKEEYIKEQKQNGYQGEFEEIIKENKKEEKMSKDNLTENCYKVYNTLEPDAQPACFNSWNEIDDYLNQTWGEYKVDMAKKNDGFGTQQDYDNYLSNFEVAIEPIEIPAEQLPAEGIDFEVADECPDCEPELTEPAEEPMNMEAEQEVEDEIEDDMDEDFEDEHIGKSEEEPAEEEPTEEDPDVEPTEIDNPKDALNRIEDVEDAVDNIEDYIKTLLSDEDIEEVEDMHEQKTEDFKDNMGMLTDMNDLDFPDALADTVDTKEDGSLYRISDVAKEIEDLKATIEQLKNDFKSELTTLVQDLKNDLKLSVNNVENKVQDTKNAVDNLTSEEEDLEDLEVEEPLEGEEPAQEEPEEPTEDEENMEENYDEEALKGNKMYESIKEIIATKTGKVISIPTIAERLREEYGIDANLNTSYGKIIYTQVADLINKTSLRESIVDPRIEEKEKRKSLLGKAANWIGGGLMSRLQESAEKQRWEALEQIKQEIDKKVQQGADAQELKDTITLASENDEEAKQAKDYAVNKLKTTAKVENLKDKLLKTSKTATFKDLNIRG